MSVAAAQYDKFKEQVVNTGRAFTLTENDELLVYGANAGDTVPFWSSKSRLEAIQKRLPKYRQFRITELTFTEFWNHLHQRENILAGLQRFQSRPAADCRVHRLGATA